jgi:hypothetical protein
LVQGDEGPAQVVWLGHRGTPSVDAATMVPSPRRLPHSISRSRLSRAARSAADQLGKPGEDGRQWSAALKRPMDVRVTYCATAVTEL